MILVSPPSPLIFLAVINWLPDMRLQYGCDHGVNAEDTQRGLQQGLTSLKQLSDFFDFPMENRLIVHQHVFANSVYIPMEGGCQDPVSSIHTAKKESLKLSALTMILILLDLKCLYSMYGRFIIHG